MPLRHQGGAPTGRYNTGQAPSVNPELISIFMTKIEAGSNVGLISNKINGALDADSTKVFTDIGTLTTSAGKGHKVQSIMDIGSDLRTAVLGKVDKAINYKAHYHEFEMWSSSPFAVMPFLAFLENGETITTTEGIGPSYQASIDTALGVESQERFFGPIKNATLAFQNGTPYWRLAFEVNALTMAKKYCHSILQREMNEDAPAYIEFFVGVVTFTPITAAITVNYNISSSTALSATARKISVLK